MEQPTQTKHQPLAAWKTRSLDVTVWERKNAHGTFFSIKAVHKFKRDEDNKWAETSSFDYADVPMLIELLKRALMVAVQAEGDARMARMRYPGPSDLEHKPVAE